MPIILKENSSCYKIENNSVHEENNSYHTRFRQICKISPIAMGLSVSFYVRVSACVTIVTTGDTLAKMQNIKNTFVDFDICHRMAASLQKLYAITLTYLLKVKNSTR